MPDVLGYRARMGVVVPSTNTIMEPELYAMAPPGVTFHAARMYAARMYVGQPSLRSPTDAEAFVRTVYEALDVGLRDIATIQPDHVFVGMSFLGFKDGREGQQHLRERVHSLVGCSVTLAGEAADQALEIYGARRIGVLSPHPPMADAHYHRLFTECGREVVRLTRLDCPTSLAIAQIDEATTRSALRELAAPEIEAIIQVGTDLAMTRLADEAERWLGKPVVAINAAMLWHALRAQGIPDRFPGFGSLLREH